MNFRSFAKLFTVDTPYNARESIFWAIKSIIGPIRENAGIVEAIPNSYVFDNGVKSELEGIFIGDIMPTYKARLSFSQGLRDFVKGSDFLVGNFAGTITNLRRKFPDLSLDQRHLPQIMGMLTEFFPPEKTYLSICNNHAGDFGEKMFLKSVNMLESHGFKVFGWDKRPYADINDNIRVVIGTIWSNHVCNYVCKLEDAERHIKSGAFNFLYPHFGYEFEFYPRPETIRLGRKLIREFDAVVGDHSHSPQPVTCETVNNTNRLLAYSMGDFCGGLAIRKYQYGIILKVQLGRNSNGKWLLGKSEWRLTRFCPTAKGNFLVDFNKDLDSVWRK